MANASSLWKRFDINSSVLETGDNSTYLTSVPIHEMYLFNNTNLESFWVDLSNDLTSERYIFSSFFRCFIFNYMLVCSDLFL